LMPPKCIYDVLPQVCVDVNIIMIRDKITYDELIIIIEVVRDAMYR